MCGLSVSLQEHHLHLPRSGGDLHIAPLHRPMVITSDHGLSIILPVATPRLVDAALHLLVLSEAGLQGHEHVAAGVQ